MDEKYPKMFFDIETANNGLAIDLMLDYDEKLNENMAAVDPDLGRIVAIGYAIGVEGEIIADIVNARNSEEKVLENFWEEFALVNGRAAGYNILKFDIPYIMRRSMALSVKPTIIPNLALYRVEPITDLMLLLCNWDMRRARKLKWICRRYNIDLLADGVDGSMVADMKPKELAKYVTSDVDAVQELYKMMQGTYFP